jgi:hypothetical protein
MSARFRTRTHTFADTDDVALSVILGSTLDEYVGCVSFRAWKNNVGEVFWRDDEGQDGGYLVPREASGWELGGAYVKASDLFLRGSAGDTVYITVIG